MQEWMQQSAACFLIAAIRIQPICARATQSAGRSAARHFCFPIRLLPALGCLLPAKRICLVVYEKSPQFRAVGGH